MCVGASGPWTRGGVEVQVRASVLWEYGDNWAPYDVELDPPRAGEVLVRIAYAGLCHSDEHTRRNPAGRKPIIGGHEASGVVEQVGDGVEDLVVGDHVVFSFMPTCRKCRWCVTGQSYLCDLGSTISTGQMPDGTFRFHGRGRDIGGLAMLGAFSERTVVSKNSCVKIDAGIPLDVAALVGCGVPTGWGSSVYVAQVEPGEVVMVYGVGGIGASAIQGALHRGGSVVAIEPKPFRAAFARSLGATAFASHEEALAHVRDRTNGQGADKVVEAVGVLTADITAQCFEATRKGGTLVLAGMADDFSDLNVQLSGQHLSLYAKRVLGTLYGGCNAHFDIPRLLGLYGEGRLKLDEMITRRYKLDDVAQGYRDMAEGTIVRGLVEINPE
jgi:NDMA-dependent alcohol dehydrogenase